MLKPIGEPPFLAPMAKPDGRPSAEAFMPTMGPVGGDHSNPWWEVNVLDMCPVEVSGNEVSGQGRWTKIPVGVDSCAATSVTPPGVFPGGVKVGQRLGEALTSACGGSIFIEGTQHVNALTDNGYQANADVHVCDVRRPLFSVHDMKEKDNSIIFSKKYGDWVFNDDAGIFTPMREENNTFLMDLWVFQRQP